MPPRFNLKDDLYQDDHGIRIVMPVEDLDRDLLDIYVETQTRKLVISLMMHMVSFIVIAIVPGRLTSSVTGGHQSLILETDFFEGPPIYSMNTIWFRNWAHAERFPSRIVYENVIPSPDLARMGPIENLAVDAGTVIGTSLQFIDPEPRSGYHGIKLRIEYRDSLPIHPSEFFSLLFWKPQYDPIFNEAPSYDYYHTLLQKMMLSREDGGPGDYVDSDWIGLKPPLRTYKRLEWEARLAHELNHDDWQTPGDLRGVLKNPLIGTFAIGRSKCNLFVGEMAFRSGFRVYAGRRAGGGSQPLYYLTGTALVNECRSAAEHDQYLFTGSTRAPQTIEWRGNSYVINKPYGRKRYVTASTSDVAIINDLITEEGRVFYYARRTYCTPISGAPSSLQPYYTEGSDCPTNPTNYDHKNFHIVILSELGAHSSGAFHWGATRILDQHCTTIDIPKICGGGYCGCRGSVASDSSSGMAFIELIPGGDPTEEWGWLDLNCLTRT